jgi:predicted DNA-binding protein (UPF0251 family)
MPRPFCCRRIGFQPEYNYFKPRGIPADQLEEIDMTLDELEAIRLADLNGMYQEQAAECMNISRPTFGRIIESAHRKIAEALITGKVLKFQKGTVEITETRKYKCNDCEFEIDVPYETPNLVQCPKCGGEKIRPLNRLRCHRRRHRKGGQPWLR